MRRCCGWRAKWNSSTARTWRALTGLCADRSRSSWRSRDTLADPTTPASISSCPRASASTGRRRLA
eukprot:469517-Lingulodinium_polyedra.AAC.1